MSLFQLSKIIPHSGKTSWIKIECDALSPKTNEDWEALAYAGSRIVGPFSAVIGIPTGGLPFAKAMEKYMEYQPYYSNFQLGYDRGPTLVVDDVLTTGDSIWRKMETFRYVEVIGLVAFARGPCPKNVKAVWQMHPDAEDAE